MEMSLILLFLIATSKAMIILTNSSILFDEINETATNLYSSNVEINNYTDSFYIYNVNKLNTSVFYLSTPEGK